MIKIFILLSFISIKIYSFDNPNVIRCLNNETIKLRSNGFEKLYTKQVLRSKISEAAILEFSINKINIAKLYPQHGLNFVLLNKKYIVETDNLTFWKLYSKENKTISSCELTYE
jgi:hypothetical protein